MKFIRTLLPLFFVWQMFSLAPFALKKASLKPKIHKTHNVLFVISLSIQIGVFIHGNISFEHYVSQGQSQIMSFLDLFTIFVIRCLSILIVIESRVKRSAQIKFLNGIEEIDRIMSDTLGIDLEYTKQHKQNLLRWILAIFFYIALVISLVVIALLEDASTFLVLVILYAPPLFISSLRYRQMIAYMSILEHRYRLINEYIERIRSSHSNDVLITSETLSTAKLFAMKFVGPNQMRNIKKTIVVNKLKSLQCVQRLLFDSVELLRDQFEWSMLFNVANDFQKLLINFYFSIMGLLTKFPADSDVLPILWAAYNINEIVMLTTACESLIREVLLSLIFLGEIATTNSFCSSSTGKYVTSTITSGLS